MEWRPLEQVVAENQLLWSELENIRDQLDDLVEEERDEYGGGVDEDGDYEYGDD